jgi:hypothetical protein
MRSFIVGKKVVKTECASILLLLEVLKANTLKKQKMFSDCFYEDSFLYLVDLNTIT